MIASIAHNPRSTKIVTDIYSFSVKYVISVLMLYSVMSKIGQRINQLK